MQTSESNFVIYKIKYDFEYCWKRFPFVKFTLIVKIYIGGNVLIITGNRMVYNAEYRFFPVWLGCKEEKALTFT